MSSNRWLTKEDILNDLEVVTGTRVKNIDDKFTVTGERPPPVNMPDEEDELIQMYGQHGSKENKATDPDLPGITHMVRMVNDYYDSAKHDDDENINELKKAAITVINISKLDPNVPEFLPQNVKNTETETKDVLKNKNTDKSDSSDIIGIRKYTSKELEVKHLVSKNNNVIPKAEPSHKSETNNNDIDVTKKIDVSSLNLNDIKDIKEKLKQKIVSTSNAQCFHKKRERNLAMASLLKLHTDTPKSLQNEPSPNPKLMTPEYFQNLPNDVQKNESTEGNQITIVENPRELTKDALNKDFKDTLFNATDPELLSDPTKISRESSDLSCSKKSNYQTNDSLIDKEREESIKKVNKWLDGPEKKKHKPKICFGPVTFKRKEIASGNTSGSQANSITDIVETPPSTETSDSFVPSAYASELTKNYMERNQSKVIQHENIWTKLERDLREKDKLLLKES